MRIHKQTRTKISWRYNNYINIKFYSIKLKDLVAAIEEELKNNQKKIGLVLGLDVNSKVTGYSVLDGQTGTH